MSSVDPILHAPDPLAAVLTVVMMLVTRDDSRWRECVTGTVRKERSRDERIR